MTFRSLSLSRVGLSAGGRQRSYCDNVSLSQQLLESSVVEGWLKMNAIRLVSLTNGISEGRSTEYLRDTCVHHGAAPSPRVRQEFDLCVRSGSARGPRGCSTRALIHATPSCSLRFSELIIPLNPASMLPYRGYRSQDSTCANSRTGHG